MHWAMMKMSSSLLSLPASNEWCTLPWRCWSFCHAVNFFKASGYVRSLSNQAGTLGCIPTSSYSWSVTIKPSIFFGVGTYNCSFFQGFLPTWGDVIKPVKYSIYFISRGSFLPPQNCISFEVSSCYWEMHTLTLWPGVYILEKLLEVI